MGAGRAILIVEDESDLAELIRFSLEREGYACRHASDAGAALAEIRRRPPDLMILDRMLPGRSGDQLLSQIRRDSRVAAMPVIMLTAKAEEADELVGLALGADDYVTKPFSMKRLVARIAAVLRRAEGLKEAAEVLTAGPVRVDAARREVTVDGAPVVLTATEFRLLYVLMCADGRVLTRNRLIDEVLGVHVAVTDRTIDVHVASLRKKLGRASALIQTIRGAGYAFRAGEHPDSGPQDAARVPSPPGNGGPTRSPPDVTPRRRGR